MTKRLISFLSTFSFLSFALAGFLFAPPLGVPRAMAQDTPAPSTPDSTPNEETLDPDEIKPMDPADDPNLLNPQFNEQQAEQPRDSPPPSSPNARSRSSGGAVPGSSGPIATPRIVGSGAKRPATTKPGAANVEEPATLTEKQRFAQRIESFDFQNAEIADVIRAISQLTGKNFILDPNVRGKISVIAPTQITVGEAYRAFLSALAINSYTVVPSGKFLKIVPARTAQRDSIDTFTSDAAPTSDQMITRIITLKNLSVADVQRYLRNLPSKDGDLIAYDPTNSLIISDYGSNIRRIMKIIDQLDRPGFEERMSVVPIRYARAKDLAALIEKIIAKDSGGGGRTSPGRLGGFPSRQPASIGATTGRPEALSLVTPDDRTNSLIVVGNQEGIDKVKTLVEELDFNLDPAVGGGVFVYRLKHSNAEAVEKTLTGLATRNPSSSAASSAAPSATRPFTPPGVDQGVFGGDIKIVAEKTTNSLIITASKQDFDVVRGLLSKIDVPRDQVYVEAIIMEINTNKTRDWKISSYYFDPATKGVARAGFGAAGTLASALNPVGDSGVVLGFGSGETFDFKFGDQTFRIPSLLSFINFLQTHTDANILSTPQILAMDNEEAMIEVGDQVPIGVQTQVTQGGISTSAPQFDKATIKLTITPHISPESNTIRMAVNQSVKQASKTPVQAAALRDITTVLSDRSLKTNIVVNNGDTVVLGGLIRDEETHTQTKVPFLGDIPILGWLFKSDSVQKSKINLMVFLTPKIIRSPVESQRLLGVKLDERIDWMRANSASDPHAARLDGLRRPALVSDPLPPSDETITPPRTEPQSERAPSSVPNATPAPAPTTSQAPAAAVPPAPAQN